MSLFHRHCWSDWERAPEEATRGLLNDNDVGCILYRRRCEKCGKRQTDRAHDWMPWHAIDATYSTVSRGRVVALPTDVQIRKCKSCGFIQQQEVSA